MTDRDNPTEGMAGYAKPPTRYRFKKGQSGNVLGRPRKDRSAITSTTGDAYLQEAHRKLRTNEGGKVSEYRTVEVAVRRQALSAAAGDLKAQKDFLAGVRRAEQDETSRNAQTYATALDYIELCEEVRREYRLRDLTPPDFEIDPDDIIIDASKQSVGLRDRARHQSGAAGIECAKHHKKFSHELEILLRLIINDRGNKAMQRDIDFLHQVLKKTTTT